MIQLSIIVPLYNSEKYIRKCLDSLLDQDIPLMDYEIIVVNDGSPDSSYDIVASYKEKYSNIVLVSQENQGTSGARNTGIKLATGKYLCFVDPDDYVYPNIYNALLQKMELEQLDMLRTDYTMVDEAYQFVNKPKGSKNMGDYSDSMVDGRTFLYLKLGYACYVWVFIFRSALLKENGLNFRKGFYIDDTEWLPRVLVKAKRVTSLRSKTYYYVQRQNSLMRTNNEAGLKKIAAMFTAIEMLKSRIHDQMDKKVKKWYRGMLSVLVLTFLADISNYPKKDQNNWLFKLKKQKIWPLSTYQHPLTLRRKIYLANISMKLYSKISQLK
jgi:glycosyltransferase involved in cell wall biosynthesis